MLSARCSRKLSAQSPPCSRKPLPPATLPSVRFSSRASPANTSGGKVASLPSTSASAAVSGYSGTWLIGIERQLSGDQGAAIVVTPCERVRASRRPPPKRNRRCTRVLCHVGGLIGHRRRRGQPWLGPGSAGLA